MKKFASGKPALRNQVFLQITKDLDKIKKILSTLVCKISAKTILLYSSWSSTANKYFSSASHHEQKNKKMTSQIKFLVVTIKLFIYLFISIYNFI